MDSAQGKRLPIFVAIFWQPGECVWGPCQEHSPSAGPHRGAPAELREGRWGAGVPGSGGGGGGRALRPHRPRALRGGRRRGGDRRAREERRGGERSYAKPGVPLRRGGPGQRQGLSGGGRAGARLPRQRQAASRRGEQLRSHRANEHVSVDFAGIRIREAVQRACGHPVDAGKLVSAAPGPRHPPGSGRRWAHPGARVAPGRRGAARLGSALRRRVGAYGRCRRRYLHARAASTPPGYTRPGHPAASALRGLSPTAAPSRRAPALR